MTDEATTFHRCPKCREPLPIAKRIEPTQLGTSEGEATPIFECPNCGYEEPAEPPANQPS